MHRKAFKVGVAVLVFTALFSYAAPQAQALTVTDVLPQLKTILGGIQTLFNSYAAQKQAEDSKLSSIGQNLINIRNQIAGQTSLSQATIANLQSQIAQISADLSAIAKAQADRAPVLTAIDGFLKTARLALAQSQ